LSKNLYTHILLTTFRTTGISVDVGTVPKALIVLKVDELPILAFVKASNYTDVAVDDTEIDKLYLEFG
jgi:hypothetical protein